MFEKVMRQIAPGWLAGRERARLRLDALKANRGILENTFNQSYSGAQRGGRHSHWHRPRTSANREIQTSLEMLRATARDLVRNNPFANRITRVLPAHIAGTGIRPRPSFLDADNADFKALSKKLSSQWDRFVENCDPAKQLDFYGFQRLVARSVIESGEALILWIPREINGSLRWRVQILEGDYIDHNKNAPLSDGGRIVQGVELNKWGERVAYWLFSDHPGEGYSSRGFTSRRVLANYVDHCFEVMRPGQVRGVSWLAPVATILRDLDGFAEAELQRKRLEACVSMVVTNGNDDFGTQGLVLSNNKNGESGGEDENQLAMLKDQYGRPIEGMSPGMILEARPGWGIEFNAPPASPGLVEHMRERLHAIAAGAGTTYMQLTGDVSQANFSSMREGRLEFERLVDAWQDDLMIVQMGRPAWQRIISSAIINGKLPSKVNVAAEWVRPKRPWVDPLKDVKAAVEEINAGLSSPQEVIARRGRDPEAVIKENSDWAEKRNAPAKKSERNKNAR